MKIAYILYHDIITNSGVTKKIKDQVEQWRKNGHEVQIYAFVPRIGQSILNARQYLIKSPWQRLLKHQNILSDLDSFKPDIVYYRYDIWTKTLSKILKKYKVVTELNTLDVHEFLLLFKERKTIRSLLIYLVYRLLRGLIFNNVKGIVAVTKEIADDFSVRKYNKKTIYIPNGINLNEYHTIKDPEYSQSRTALFFMGTPNQPWHGVDIIECLAKKLPQYDFHIVGINGNSSTDNIFWHGYLQKEDYLQILKQCHVCIGTLALYRNKLQEACPIKVREYFAYGYPSIIGYKDTSFLTSNPDFLFYLKPSLDNIDEMVNFIEKNKKRIVLHDEIKTISTEYTENQRLLFFEEVVNNQ
jgi:hypothetical protein